MTHRDPDLRGTPEPNVELVVDEQAWRECAHRADYLTPAEHALNCAYHLGEVDENGFPVDALPPNARAQS